MFDVQYNYMMNVFFICHMLWIRDVLNILEYKLIQQLLTINRRTEGVLMKAGMEQNGINQGARQILKIVLNRLCTVSNFHTITIIVARSHLLKGSI